MIARIALSALLLAAPALAETPPPAVAGEVLTLSDADRAAMDAEAEKRALDVADDRIGGDRRIHGTMEMMVGTGGRTGVALTMVAPLGDDGILALGFLNEQGRWGRGFGRRR